MIKKNNLLIIFVLAAFAGAVSFFISHRRVPTLRSAKQFELSGDLQQAHSLYTAALFEIAPSIELPDINRSKILSPAALKKEVEKYFIWINRPAAKARDGYLAALAGMARCEGDDRRDNTISDPVITALNPEAYLVEWNKTFFAPNVAADPSHIALASGNYRHKLSLLVLKSSKNYTYEINLINKATGRGTRALLLAENSVRLYAPPGEHLLLCRSTVTFPSEKIWHSNYTPIPITVPDTVSLITFELRTSVHRRLK